MLTSELVTDDVVAGVMVLLFKEFTTDDKFKLFTEEMILFTVLLLIRLVDPAITPVAKFL
ncbi:MAG: hypothetical protein BWY70_02022 [Bacteroidetes bacterium ADurb.Bin408]|nr:MAG: hypothetical protein BWY70_02022 [Bacteroidetes bacterium ADurb.Bin408]